MSIRFVGASLLAIAFTLVFGGLTGASVFLPGATVALVAALTLYVLGDNLES